jgi:hypothetical protein
MDGVVLQALRAQLYFRAESLSITLCEESDCVYRMSATNTLDLSDISDGQLVTGDEAMQIPSSHICFFN